MDSIVFPIMTVILIGGACVCWIVAFRSRKAGEKFLAGGEMFNAAALRAKFVGHGYAVYWLGGILAALGGACAVVYWGSRLL